MTDANAYGLGRLRKSDPRDHEYLMAAILETKPKPIVRSVSYRSERIYNQGPTPTCVGHAWRAWLDGEPIRQYAAGPSPFGIYDQAQRVDEWPGEAYSGTSVRAGAKVLAALGLINGYIWAFDEITCRQWMLSRHGGVVIGVNWYESMFTPDNKGFLTIDGPIAGGHALWVRGYNRVRNAYHLQNSWGEEWGIKGQAWLRAADLDRLIKEDGEACCGTEVRIVKTH